MCRRALFLARPHQARRRSDSFKSSSASRPRVRDDFLGAVGFRVVEFDETAGVQIRHDSPPRASETSSLSRFHAVENRE